MFTPDNKVQAAESGWLRGRGLARGIFCHCLPLRLSSASGRNIAVFVTFSGGPCRRPVLLYAACCLSSQRDAALLAHHLHKQPTQIGKSQALPAWWSVGFLTDKLSSPGTGWIAIS